MHETMATIVGAPIPAETFRELQLPMKPLTDGSPTFGIGLYSAVDTAPAAYLSSIALTTNLRKDVIIDGEPLDLNSHHYAKQAHRMLTLRVPGGGVPPP